MTGPSEVSHHVSAANGKRRARALHTARPAKDRNARRPNDSKRSVHVAAAMPRQAWNPARADSNPASQQAHAIVESLAVIGLPAAVLNYEAELISSNKPFRALLPGALKEVQGRIHFADASINGLLAETLARMSSARSGGVRSIPIRGRQGQPATIVHLLPLAAGDDEAFSAEGVILVVTTTRSRTAPSLEMLRDLFGLSPAEARVARGIAERLTVEKIAERWDVSRETVRCQLKTVLAKTGAKRQLDLAVMLLGLPLPKL